MTAAGDKIDGRSKRRPGVDQQRETIRRTAVSLFARAGTRSVSIAQICDAAQVSRPTFYRCYTDKNALVEDIYAEAVATPSTDFQLRANLHDSAALREQLDALFERIFANADIARVIFVEASDPGSPAAKIIEEGFARSARTLARDLKKAGITPPSTTYLKSVMAAVQWLVHDAINKGLDARSRAEAKQAAFRLVVNALNDTAS
ncbi:MAG: TetR/AcrR family transcriptional regulator [Halioglobus sp.]|nr:TetR/AcrR family transcriptional regulator [Halioglobus sp.]